MNVNISVTRMIHSGESKYYTVFAIVADGGSKSITVCHYGAMPKAGYIPHPKEMGKIIIHMGDVMTTKVWEKDKRGYRRATTDSYHTSMDSLTIDEIFGKFAPQIRGHFNTLGYKPDEDEAPSFKVHNTKTVAIQPEPERPAGWGSW